MKNHGYSYSPMKCPACGETLQGDGYTNSVNCPNYEGDPHTPDCAPFDCNGFKIKFDKDGKEIETKEFPE